MCFPCFFDKFVRCLLSPKREYLRRGLCYCDYLPSTCFGKMLCFSPVTVGDGLPTSKRADPAHRSSVEVALASMPVMWSVSPTFGKIKAPTRSYKECCWRGRTMGNEWKWHHFPSHWAIGCRWMLAALCTNTTRLLQSRSASWRGMRPLGLGVLKPGFVWVLVDWTAGAFCERRCQLQPLCWDQQEEAALDEANSQRIITGLQKGLLCEPLVPLFSMHHARC